MAVYKTKDGYVMKGTIKRGPNDYYNYTKKLKGVTTKKEAQKIELDFKDKFNFEQKQKVSSVTFKELTELYDDKVKNNIKAREINNLWTMYKRKIVIGNYGIYVQIEKI